MLTKLATEVWLAVVAAYRAGNAAEVGSRGAQLLRLILDMDALLTSVP